MQLFFSITMSSTRKRKPSERLVSCYYCQNDAPQIAFKNLERHTERIHGQKSRYPPREKGQKSIFDCIPPKKRGKVSRAQEKSEVPPEDRTSHSSSSTLLPMLTSLVANFTGILSAFQPLLDLLNPFREAVGSIEKSATRLEALFEEKNTKQMNTMKTYVNHENFAREHGAEGLVIYSSHSKFYGLCKVCMKHSVDLGGVKNFQKDWVVSGRLLDQHKLRKWKRHVTSTMHKKAVELESQPKLKSVFARGSDHAKLLTFNFFRIVYSGILMFLPYNQFHRLFATLYLCNYELGQRHHNDKAVASACDTVYDFLNERLKHFLSTKNECTGRARCFGITADKGTEVNQRQVINIHVFDLDGKLVTVQLAAHLINEISVDGSESEESTAKALLAHIIFRLKAVGLCQQLINKNWTSICTDKEACYLLLAKLQTAVFSGFVGIPDASHGMESLFEDVEKSIPWFGRTLSVIDTVHARYSGSPKKKRKLRRTADIFDMVYVGLKRIVETRYIKFAVVAGDSLLKMLKSIVAVLEDDIATTKDESAIGVLASLLKVTSIPHLMAVLDVLDHAVSFSVASQSGKFPVFDYLLKRRTFIERIKIMASPDFNVEVKCPGNDRFLSQRLRRYKNEILTKVVCNVELGKSDLVPNLRSFRAFSGEQLFESCLQRQESLCNTILEHCDRLPEDSLFLSIERTLSPERVLSAPYESSKFAADIKSICQRFHIADLLSSITVCHEKFVHLLRTRQNDPLFADVWKFKTTWNPLAVIETFLNPHLDLHVGMEDFCVLLERVGLLRFSQADTERVVKVIRKVEPRFASYTEVKEANGKRDRALQEIYLHENKVALEDLPLEMLNQKWLKHHLPSLKKISEGSRSKSIETFLKKDKSKARFFTM